MNADRVERLITLILNSGADESEKTRRIEMILKQHELWANRRYS